MQFVNDPHNRAIILRSIINSPNATQAQRDKAYLNFVEIVEHESADTWMSALGDIVNNCPDENIQKKAMELSMSGVITDKW